MPLEWSAAEKSQNGMTAMVAQGVGKIAGAPIIGYVQDNHGQNAAIVVCLGLTTTGMLWCLWYAVAFEYSLAYAVIMNFVMGAQDGAVNILLSCKLGFEFESKTTPFSCRMILQ